MSDRAHPTEYAGHRHWVLIETGGNQRYIFGSNRLRHVVGASQLVHEVGTEWVPTAVGQLGGPDATVVMTASGKALLLVGTRDAGRAVIRDVSEQALRKAPGLLVTGAVGPPFDAADPAAHEPARSETYALHAKARAARRDPLLRDRVFPWHRLCRDSGQPAADEERYGEDEPVAASAEVLARSDARHRARNRLLQQLPGDLGDVVPANTDDLRQSGWAAVVHADGNGVGDLFRGFIDHVMAIEGTDSVDLATHLRYQRQVSAELETATWDAVRDAVAALQDQRAGEDLTGRLLPIVVGGDDVTLICDAALAVPFVRAFAEGFARRTADQPTLSAIACQATGHAGLTASAGVAVIKPHHPFGAAYELAAALTVSAKQFRSEGGSEGEPRRGPQSRSLAAFDLHVAHTSTLQDLTLLREHTEPAAKCGPRVARYAGPYLLGPVEDLPVALRHRSVELLDEINGWLGRSGWLSAAQAHALREAADRSLAEYRHQMGLTVARAPDPGRAGALLDVQPPPPRPVADGGRTAAADRADVPFLRLFDAMHLHGLRPDAFVPNPPTDRSASKGGVR
ncbi:Cas10/Cmr2 second palm domain-containing protein [Solwaraspora sp. WMMB335]|uniref:Cas10/Cmr2 second palm domain-containing protein n=1 Tax=Solwaraspora sp. WMMB335 TaxID=3404118 RepID=UPI003B9226B0